MMRASVVVVAVLTVLIFIGLRWREQRVGTTPKFSAFNFVARGKHAANRWVTAAALAVVLTLVVMGGLHWLRIWRLN